MEIIDVTDVIAIGVALILLGLLILLPLFVM